jgi:hypothetical protein
MDILNFESSSIATSSKRDREGNIETKVVQYSSRFKAIESDVPLEQGFLEFSYFFDFDLILHILTTRKDSYRIIFLPIIIFCALSTAGICGVYYASDSDYKMQVHKTRLQTESVSVLLELTVKRAFLSLYSLQTAVYANNNGTKIVSNYDKIASSILEASSNSITALAFSPNGKVKAIYPLKGNQKAIGHDLFAINPGSGMYQGGM